MSTLNREDRTMLTSALIVLLAAVALFILATRVKAQWSRRNQAVYVCDICDEQDCQCHRKR
jgi:hypothetical protein